MATTAAKNTAPAALEVTESKAPEVKPAHVEIDPGQNNRRVMVRMPEGAVSDDLRDPKIWRRVQAVRQSALLKYDELLIFGFDESWGAQAIVKMATGTEAHLTILKVFSFQAVARDCLVMALTRFFGSGSILGFAVSKTTSVLSHKGFPAKASPSTRCAGSIRNRWPDDLVFEKRSR